ncbi:MAG TPA: hypothetical protein VIU41_13390, partial [Geobacteraceae bacterium]
MLSPFLTKRLETFSDDDFVTESLCDICQNADIYLDMKKRVQPANSDNEQAHSAPKETPSRHESLLFPIVGIGASAG